MSQASPLEPGGVSADREVDQMYRPLRDRYGPDNARANGYRYHGYFLREQELLLAALERPARGTIVDIACGSGLMLRPLCGGDCQVVGVDFNDDACRDARDNGLAVIRGDAYSLPLATASVDQAVNCQFLNQQTHANAGRFLEEAARSLRPGGRLVIVWRNGDALIHKIAHAVYRVLDRLAGRPAYPCVDHDIAEIEARSVALGLDVVARRVTFPPLRWQTAKTTSLAARLIGASYLLVLRKPDGSGRRSMP